MWNEIITKFMGLVSALQQELDKQYYCRNHGNSRLDLKSGNSLCGLWLVLTGYFAQAFDSSIYIPTVARNTE